MAYRWWAVLIVGPMLIIGLAAGLILRQANRSIASAATPNLPTTLQANRHAAPSTQSRPEDTRAQPLLNLSAETAIKLTKIAATEESSTIDGIPRLLIRTHGENSIILIGDPSNLRCIICTAISSPVERREYYGETPKWMFKSLDILQQRFDTFGPLMAVFNVATDDGSPTGISGPAEQWQTAFFNGTGDHGRFIDEKILNHRRITLVCDNDLGIMQIRVTAPTEVDERFLLQSDQAAPTLGKEIFAKDENVGVFYGVCDDLKAKHIDQIADPNVESSEIHYAFLKYRLALSVGDPVPAGRLFRSYTKSFASTLSPDVLEPWLIRALEDVGDPQQNHPLCHATAFFPTIDFKDVYGSASDTAEAVFNLTSAPTTKERARAMWEKIMFERYERAMDLYEQYKADPNTARLGTRPEIPHMPIW